MINLMNDLTLRMTELIHITMGDNTGIIMRFLLEPTVGSIVQDETVQPDKFRRYDITIIKQHADDLAVYQIIKDMGPTSMVNWLKTDYQAYVAATAQEQADWNPKLSAIYSYIVSVGLKP
jgi:hypothetical protein